MTLICQIIVALVVVLLFAQPAIDLVLCVPQRSWRAWALEYLVPFVVPLVTLAALFGAGAFSELLGFFR